MAAPTRFTKIGLQGRKDTELNSQDSYIKTYEFPVEAIASAAEQDTGISAPTKAVQVLSAILYVNTAEVTGTTKTVEVGTTAGSGSDALTGTSVAATGPAGTPVAAAFVGGGNWSFTLGSADFAELDAVCVVTVLAIDS